MNTPVQRASLPDQTVAILKRGIESAHWTRELPSETALCRELQVSRDTLRKALAQLVRERWVALGGRGCHHRIRRRARQRTANAGRIIRVLSPDSLFAMGGVQHVALEVLAERVAAAGYRLEYEWHPRLYRRHQPAQLHRLTTLPDTAGWILFYSTEPMQRWFAASGLPCLVSGPVHEGVELSCVYPDTRAFARHAAGLLHARGHREFVYLTASQTSFGDQRAAAAFLEEARRLGANARLANLGADINSARREINDLLARRPRPTGWCMVHTGFVVTLLCTLLGAGLRIPQDAAILVGWTDVLLTYTVPSMAHYRIDGAKFGRKLATTLLDLLAHGPGKLRDVRILPEFVPGGTLSAG